MRNGKLRGLLITVMLLVFLAGLASILYPYIWGAAVDSSIASTAKDFLEREEPELPATTVIIDSIKPEKVKPYPELWEDMVRYNQNIAAQGQSALCRAKADWLVGINASRFFSLTYKTKLNVGRVMSPTLALLVQRQSAISAFTPESYYTVDLGIGEFHAVSDRFPSKTEAEALAVACKAANTAVVKEIRQQEKKEAAPALYDLTSLQRDANRLLGYTAQQTLDYLQALYEKKLCTYPRTDSRYLTDDMLPRVKEILLWASGICDLPITDEIYGEQLCNSKKVTDHHAIIPTKAASWQDLEALPMGEQNILKLISRQVMIATSGPYCYKEADAMISCGGADFKLHLKMPQDHGWKRYTAEKKGGGKWFPGLATGQALTPDTVTVKDSKTQPPKPFTEDICCERGIRNHP